MLHFTTGEVSQMKEDYKSKQKMLSSFKDVEAEYRHTLIKKEASLMLTNDLQKYYRALDKAVMRFHAIKLSEINNIMRELWYAILSSNERKR